jgi:hypothetical protein
MQSKANQDLIVSHLESGLEMHLKGMRSHSVRRGADGLTPAPIHRLLGYTPVMRKFEMPETHIKLDPSPLLLSLKNQDVPSPKRIKRKPQESIEKTVQPSAPNDATTNTEDLKRQLDETRIALAHLQLKPRQKVLRG